MDIKHLHKEGNSIKGITRLTGHSRNTVRRVVRQAKPKPFRKPTRHSCLDDKHFYSLSDSGIFLRFTISNK